MNNATAYYRSSSIQGLFEVILLLLILLLVSTLAGAAEPDKTPEDIQKKAVIIKYPSVKLFKQATADTGDEASFMQLYFIMKPEINGRIPVSRSPNKTGEPDGWLAKDSFMEWNTVQMIQLEPQSGRKLAKVFNTQQCVSSFAREGQTPAGCEELGEEPSAWGNKKLENQKLLIPVFSKEQESFEGGFIRVFESGQAVNAVSNATSSGESKTQQTLDYDIVFAVDSTGSMGQWFAPTTEVIQTFIKNVQHTMGSDEIKMALRIGVLFYRDRLTNSNLCSIEYLHKWGQELTGEIDSVVKALQNEREATCSSEEEPESVLDGLNRVIVDTKWQDNAFKAIILVGDASPHPATYEKNPMKLDVPTILKQSEEKSIRFLNIKLGEEDEAFKNLAFAVQQQNNRGRYAIVPKGEIDGFKSALLKVLNEEWGILTKANQIQRDRQTGKTTLSGGTADFLGPDFLKKYGLNEYEALIIQARLPATADPSQALPAFLKGWAPEKIQGRLVASEFVFMDKSKLKILTNTLENLAESALVGEREGPDAFVSTVQNALASQLSMQPSEVFRSGETLDGILKKANILPFKTTVLAFSAQEIQSWKAPDYQRLNTILSEKVKYLRELQDNATALHMFGDRPHLYVPRTYFP